MLFYSFLRFDLLRMSGLAVGMQIMAFGASKPLPFQQAICQSQALEPGITGNFTIDAMQSAVDHAGCIRDTLHSNATIDCLRKLDMDTLLNASVVTYQSDAAHNIGDIWLPVVDGDFLPASPSQLIQEGRFGNVTTMMGWCEDDLNIIVGPGVRTANDSFDYLSSYAPGVTDANIDKLLLLYPASDFADNAAANLTGEFYRTSRIIRDIVMVCEPFLYGEHLSRVGNDVFLYDWNQTVLERSLASELGLLGLGVIHTSDLAYVFGDLSLYNATGLPYELSSEDFSLADRGSRSWSTFVGTGKPSLGGHDTFVGFEPAFASGENIFVFIAGGPSEGLSAVTGPKAKPSLELQQLRDRCGFINSPEIIQQLNF
jgi:carboxylesterase type B